MATGVGFPYVPSIACIAISLSILRYISKAGSNSSLLTARLVLWMYRDYSDGCEYLSCSVNRAHAPHRFLPGVVLVL